MCFQQCLRIEEQQQKPLPVTRFNCINSNIFPLTFSPLNFPRPPLLTNSSNTFFTNPAPLATHESSGKTTPLVWRAPLKVALCHRANQAQTPPSETPGINMVMLILCSEKNFTPFYVHIVFSFFSNQKLSHALESCQSLVIKFT